MNCDRIRATRVPACGGSRLLPSAVPFRATQHKNFGWDRMLKVLTALITLAITLLLVSCSSVHSNTTSTGLPNGTYVFHLAGVDYTSARGTSNYYVAGAITVSGGTITGEQDFSDFNGVVNNSFVSLTSSIATTSDGNLQIVLDTGNINIGVKGVETINATLLSSNSARIVEFDSFASGTGSLEPQSGVAAPTGGYAFFASGLDSNALPLAFGGVINVDGSGTISGAGSVLDLNDAPFKGIISAQTLSASTVSTPDSFGRVAFSLVTGNGTIGTINLAGYEVTPNTIYIVEIADNLAGTAGGTARSQGTNTGNFSSASVSGSAYVFGASGQETVSGSFLSAGGYIDVAGALAFNSGSTIGGTLSFNDLSTSAVAQGTVNAGTYTVDPTGRMTITGLAATDPNSGVTFGPIPLQLYLDGSGNAFAISMDPAHVAGGPSFQQTSGASLSGVFALTANGVTPIQNLITLITTLYPWGAVGPVTVTNNPGAANGFTDLSALTQGLTANLTFSGNSTGTGGVLTGKIGGLGVASLAVASGAANPYTYYVIDSNRAIAIETDATQLSLAYAQASSK